MRKLDRVFVEGLILDTQIGILPTEKDRKQPLAVDFGCRLDTRKAAISGDLRFSVDYAAAAESLRQLAASRAWDLLETFAEEAARLLLDNYPIDTVTLTVRKPQALGGNGIPGVRIRRKK